MVRTIGTTAQRRWEEHASWRGAVQLAELPGGQQVWVISGYNEVTALLADERLSLDKRHSGGGYAGFALPPALDRNLLNMDGDEHGRIRRLAVPAFSRRSTESLELVVRRIADETFAALAESAGETVDLLDRLCVPVPALVIGDLLGVPADLHPGLRDAATAMVTFDAASKESGRRLGSAIGWLTTTFTALIDAKRAEAGDDLLSGWIRAADDETLTGDELVSLAFLMMLAGLENAVHLCGNLIAALLGSGGITATDWAARRRDLMERANPLPFAIRRFAVTDLTVGGHTIPRGDTVLLSVFGADSDPARAGRPSLMFGRGPHYCLGARTADLIVDAVVPEFFARHPRARLAVPPAESAYRNSWRAHGLVALPVVLDA
ncbi:cytochrome P450 [Nocardia sp. NBC_01730]|uniref:cytochrome P450 n=1 Tax=Nocardia sp. NBC_01730 TaxID=2975998 RepID=UPI002E150165|nr:cytochrome P450 [Nocardia sp. NBC_01730]